MTPFADDITDSVVHMLWVEVDDCENYELARDVLWALREGGLYTTGADGQMTTSRRVLDLLVDALLPEGVAGNLDFGITARTILDFALFYGLNMFTLKDNLEAWESTHHFMSD